MLVVGHLPDRLRPGRLGRGPSDDEQPE
jgi:hypothetical protein